MVNRKLYQELAVLVQARKNCIEADNVEWAEKHASRIKELADKYLPSGSGIDAGCSVDLTESSGDKLCITTSFHHMDEAGGYDGWTDHKVIIKPSLAHGFVLGVSGRDRNNIKDYLYDLFRDALNTELD